MISRFFDCLGELVEQLAETNQRVDHETGKNRESDCRNQTGDFSNTHLVPLFSPTVAREHNTRITVVKSPDLRQVSSAGHWLYDTTVTASAIGLLVSKSSVVTDPFAGRSLRS